MFRTIADTERWEWYAAGDKSLARPAASRPGSDNSPERILWELGLVFVVPLALAALAGVVLA